MSMNIARFVFQGPIPGDDVSRETYAIEAQMAGEQASRAPPDEARRLIAYAARMVAIHARLGWAPDGSQRDGPIGEMLRQAKSRVKRVYEWRGQI